MIVTVITIVLQGMPMNSNFCSIKRKFEAPITQNGNGTSLQKEWSCTPYQVAVTCEQGLKDHLNGRKHMGKEKAVLKLMAREKAKAMLTSTKTVNIDADNSEASAEETMKRRRNGVRS